MYTQTFRGRGIRPWAGTEVTPACAAGQSQETDKEGETRTEHRRWASTLETARHS